MYVISQDQYERIQQNSEGNVKIVPTNAEPTNGGSKEVKIESISDGLTKTEFEKDNEASNKEDSQIPSDIKKTALEEVYKEQDSDVKRAKNTKNLIIKIGFAASILFLLYLLTKSAKTA